MISCQYRWIYVPRIILSIGRYTAASKKRKGYCRPTILNFPLEISKYFTAGVLERHDTASP
jgi:hypothetical protein